MLKLIHLQKNSAKESESGSLTNVLGSDCNSETAQCENSRFFSPLRLIYRL